MLLIYSVVNLLNLCCVCVLYTPLTLPKNTWWKVGALLSQKIQNLNFLFHMSVCSSSVITTKLWHY